MVDPVSAALTGIALVTTMIDQAKAFADVLGQQRCPVNAPRNRISYSTKLFSIELNNFWAAEFLR